MATEVAADALGGEWKGHVVRISGGNNKQAPKQRLGEKPRTKAPNIQHLLTPRVLQHKRRRIALKKQHTKKNKEEAAEYAKLLAKRMKEAKEKRQEQIAKRRRLSSLRASTSKSESSQK
ncbi:hypothetical protein E5288_WYG010285 [Bos mutus]|uniref:Small ribosomal subunit protein eS6 n=1 Tax=Bos mutus TaxID=72004 RepID=A0A6B0R8A3_9CETA|nr:hypothetical protein [Bos mutus]